MAYQDIPENPQFNNQIRKIETTDLVHADIMNEILSKMLESDVFLKAFAEGLAAKVQEHAEKKEIHVTATDKTAWNETYQQSTGYTDQKIAELINGAPETLDTLKEIADAMAENNTVVEALDTAIGKKADAAEFETLQKKYYSMVGNNDISSIGDGTLTGAVSSLNTDMNAKIKNLLIGYRLNAGDTAYVLGNYGYYRCGIALVFAASTILTETTMLLIDTAQDATDAGGTIKIIESSINYINTKTGCNEYYLWGGKLCIYNLQSDHEYLTVRFIPFF